MVKLFIMVLPIYHKFLVIRLRHKKTINVVFFAMSLSQWRYQRLYEELSKLSKFKTHIIIQPVEWYSESQKEKEISALVNFFESRNTPFILGTDKAGNITNIRREVSPDILFYPQPYHGYYHKELAYGNFRDKLICYYPYAFWMGKDDWSYNLRFHNIAWKLFYPSVLHKKDAQLYSDRQGVNMVITGYPTADDFLYNTHNDLWKPQAFLKKRIIWAPHFTIVSSGFTKQSTFLEIAGAMLEVAKKYRDLIQIAFKPHPRLYTELCNYPEWGEDEANKYYEQWATMPNTQIETGEFVDLFMTSDAMIHDCGSFAVEYHYSENPVMYLATDFEKQVEEKNEFGKLAMRQHYVGTCEQDIVRFIEDVVLAGNDPMKDGRVQFKKDYLLPPNGKTVAENTMDVFIKAFC